MSMINSKRIYLSTIICGILLLLILVFGTIWTDRCAEKEAENAVNTVSLLYLDDLAGRRDQIITSAVNRKERYLESLLTLLTDEYLCDIYNLEKFMTKVKQLFALDKLALVDEDGVIYTSSGILEDNGAYDMVRRELTGTQVFIKDLNAQEKDVIIAIPVENLEFQERQLRTCFLEISMTSLLEGVTLTSDNNDTTFCNIYNEDGRALSNLVLDGLASEPNLLDALENAEFEKGASVDIVRQDFKRGNGGVVSFVYKGTRKTLFYVQIEGTDWMLAYLIRESIISDEINSVSGGIIARDTIQTVLTIFIVILMFVILFQQFKANAQLVLEKETAETENRVKQDELERRVALQEQLIEQEKLRTQQDHMITAMACDYRSVYYANLDTDECICYRSSVTPEYGPQVGDRFSFRDGFTRYANNLVTEAYLKEFLSYIEPDFIRSQLAKEQLITYRYQTLRDGEKRYEMLRIASVHSPENREDDTVHAISVGIADIDAEMRDAMAQRQALSDALTSAEEASKAKTAFLSNMSHEIRTPMNAIIGLDNIALSDPDISAQTRDYLEKIGGSANHLLGIINDILDMSRIESGRMVLKNEEFSFSKLLEQINTIFSGQCADKGLHYLCQINGTVDDYYIGDNTKLRQVLVNILGNAVKFTPEGGSVTLTVERKAQFNGQTTLCFMISDTGIGISEEFLPHLYDTFAQEDSSSTNKYGSSGLGLAITKNIIEMMNGAIDVQSEKGVGTTFTVTVTLMLSEHQNIGSDEVEIHPHEMNVLVVDDDPIACEHAKVVLEQIGISCDTVLSGAEAVEAAKLHHARQEAYHLILVDLKMPEMDGVETTRQLRSIVKDESAIIIITAYKWDDVLEEAVAAGVDSFIAKPLFAANVIEEFSSALQKKHVAAEQAVHKADLKGRHILLAEDVQINADIMKMVLKMREMEVDHAENGKVAVELFCSKPEGYYDAILMDIRMPEMNGLDAAAAIRGTDRADAADIPIIALTANAFDEDVQRSLQAGMNAHLTKPVEAPVLYETLENLIRDE